jgi:hypothetical protein
VASVRHCLPSFAWVGVKIGVSKHFSFIAIAHQDMRFGICCYVPYFQNCVHLSLLLETSRRQRARPFTGVRRYPWLLGPTLESVATVSAAPAWPWLAAANPTSKRDPIELSEGCDIVGVTRCHGKATRCDPLGDHHDGVIHRDTKDHWRS